MAGWTATGLWHLASTSCVAPGYASATNSFYYGQETTCNYSTGLANTGTLTSPAISGLNASATLTFSYWRQVESFSSGAYDKTYVQVSYDGGTTWLTVWSRDSRNASENAWTPASVPLSPTSATMRVRFVFDTIDGQANTYRGWLIDDVAVRS